MLETEQESSPYKSNTRSHPWIDILSSNKNVKCLPICKECKICQEIYPNLRILREAINYLIFLLYSDALFSWWNFLLGTSVCLPSIFLQQMPCHRLKDTFFTGRVWIIVLLHSFSALEVEIQAVSHKGTHQFEVEGDDDGFIAFIDNRKQQRTFRGGDWEKIYKHLISF